MTKRYIQPILSDSIRLRLLDEVDLPVTLAWRNRDDIRIWFFTSDKITLERHIEWFRRYLDLDNDFIFIIEDVKSGYKPVGQVSLYNIDWDAKRAEYGRLMIGDQDSTGRGFARLATEVLLDLAFKKLGLEEVYLEVFANNDRAIRIYEAAGFSIMEGNGNTIRMHILGKV